MNLLPKNTSPLNCIGVKSGCIISGISLATAGGFVLRAAWQDAKAADGKLGTAKDWPDTSKALATQNDALGRVAIGLAMFAGGIAIAALGASIDCKE